MHLVQHFKTNFGHQAQEVHAITSPEVLPAKVQLHYTSSSGRNVCFIWEDGHMAFFNYAYLIAAEFQEDSCGNIITLSFSTYTVSLNGYRLDSLFVEFLDHLPRQVFITNQRYEIDGEAEAGPIVIKITVIAQHEL